jgi:hypothetical protein
MLACMLKTPEWASLAVAETSKADAYQPCFPSTGGTTGLNPGGVTSRFQADDPLAVLPLLEAAMKFAVPVPSGKANEQTFPHVKGVPARSPVMVTACPCGSLATSSRLASPRHQPASPHRSQTTCPFTIGGKGVEVPVGDGIAVGVLVAVGVKVMVPVGDDIDVGVNVAVAVGVGVRVGVNVKVGSGVKVWVAVGGGTV